jgi:hypothetical protein
MTEIDTDFVKPDQNCSNCDTEYTCFDCEREQVKTKYPNAHYEGLGVWKEKTNWVSWSYDSLSSDIAESILQEVNFMLKDKGIFISSYLNTEQEDFDFKMELSLEEERKV